MQGKIFDLAGKAGRHFLQLVKDYFWVRISLFIVLCLGMIFVGNNGLGQPPQAITAFSEGKSAHSDKTCFQEIKGMNRATTSGPLMNPFGESAKESPVQPTGNKARTGVTASSKPNGRVKKPMGKTALPVLQGIMSGGTSRAVLVEYQGKQYILYAGDSLGDFRLESIDEEEMVWQTPAGRQVLNVHSMGKQKEW